jgi:hypothetical protein
MNELLARLTNLSYELFGVILPGIVMSLFICLGWTAPGPLVPLWTYGAVPELTVATARIMIESLSVAVGIGIAIPALAVWYFLGHLLLWIARSGTPDPKASEKWHRRVALSLRFRIPKPRASFDPGLKSLYKVVQSKFAVGESPLEWHEFYPVVKSYLSQRLTNSLVPTYQNKYTLHRSIATAAAVLFWFSLLALGSGLITFNASGSAPHWVLLFALLGSSLLLVWGFSASYMYYWEMFGNTIITEAYSLICYPKDDQSKR